MASTTSAATTVHDTKKDLQIDKLNTTVDKARAALERLDDEYTTLDQEEQRLLDTLESLQTQETSLNVALKEASESGAQRRERDKKQRDAAAVARMHSALFEESSDSSGEE